MHIIYVGTTYVKSLIFGTLIPKSHNQIWERQIRNKAVTTLIFFPTNFVAQILELLRLGILSRSQMLMLELHGIVMSVVSAHA